MTRSQTRIRVSACSIPIRRVAENGITVTCAACAGCAAATARADDAAALFYNPAGLAFLKGFRLKTNIIFADRTVNAAMPEGGRTYHSSPNEILGAHAAAWQPVRRRLAGSPAGRGHHARGGLSLARPPAVAHMGGVPPWQPSR